MRMLHRLMIALLGMCLPLAVAFVGLVPDAVAQAPGTRLLPLATTGQDSSEIRQLVRGLGRYIPLLAQDGQRVPYAATEGIVEEGPAALRVWFVLAETGGEAEAVRARIRCNGRVRLFPTTALGLSLLNLADSSAMAAATCRLLALVAPTREQDAGGAALAARIAADSAALSRQRWRSVLGYESLEIAPASRRETPAGTEAWVRYDNGAGGKTTALILVQCKEGTRQVLQGSGTDSEGVETPLPRGPRERVAPEISKERQLLTVCRRYPLAPLVVRHGDPVPPTLLSDLPTEPPTTTVQSLLDAGPGGWLATLMRRTSSR